MNSYGLSPTAPSRQRVYQFHHLGVSARRNESGRSGRIRTPDRRFWRPLLYRAELHSFLVARTQPTRAQCVAHCSTVSRRWSSRAQPTMVRTINKKPFREEGLRRGPPSIWTGKSRCHGTTRISSQSVSESPASTAAAHYQRAYRLSSRFGSSSQRVAEPPRPPQPRSRWDTRPTCRTTDVWRGQLLEGCDTVSEPPGHRRRPRISPQSPRFSSMRTKS